MTNTERDEELERMREAFRFIIDGYARIDINHEEFRVQAYKAALYAMGEEQ